MGVKLISGPINSGKTAEALKLLSRCDPGRTGTIVVPDRAIAADLRRRFSEDLKGSFKAVRGDAVQDWRGFVRALARPALPVATPQHCAMMMLGLLPKLKLSYFGRPIRSYALARGLAQTIIKLKANLVGPSDLAEILDSLGCRRPRERDLVAAYRAYDKWLTGAGLLDEGDLTLLAMKNALEGNLGGLATIVFDEFAMPTPGQLAMARALGKAAEVHVTCPTAHGGDEQFFAEWLARARDTWLAACEEEVRLAAPEPVRPKVEIVRASSPAQEARHVALMVADEGPGCVVASSPGDSFTEWYLSEAHSMGLLPEHPTLDGANGSTLAHTITSREIVERLPAKALIQRHVDAMFELADVKTKARGWIRGLKERRGHGRVAARNLTATAIVEETLRGLAVAAPLTGRTEITREQFAQLLSDELSRKTAPSTMVESVLPFRAHRLGTPFATEAPRLIVPRMVEGGFPTGAGETLFFGDWEEESIRRIFPDAEEQHAREAYAFETMLCKCGGLVTLAMPRVTDGGSETIPSPFADRFLKGREPRALPPCILDRTSLGRDMDALARAFDVESARMAGYSEDTPFAPYMGILGSDEARGLVRRRFTEGEMSPTSLERYANCPFSFFARDVLRVKEPLEDTPQIRRLDRGKLVHEVLTRYYKSQQSQQSQQGKQRIERIVREIVQEVWAEGAGGLEYVKPGLKQRELAQIADMALCVIRAETAEAARLPSPLKPSAFEWEFGREQGNALQIEIEGDEPLSVRGRVDRVDLDSDGSRFLVIDYKSGGAEQVAGRVESGRHLQLPLYIAAVRRGLYPDAMALGGLLLVIRDIEESGDAKKTPGKTKGLVLKAFDGSCYSVGRSHSKMDEDRLWELIAAAETRSAEYASRIRGGIFPAADDADCDWCEYGDICRQKGVSAD